MPSGYEFASSPLFTSSPVLDVVAAIRLMMTSWLIRGLPRQFWLRNENRRCSILFHLLVPGGKWQMEISNPVSSASCYQLLSRLLDVRKKFGKEAASAAATLQRKTAEEKLHICFHAV